MYRSLFALRVATALVIVLLGGDAVPAAARPPRPPKKIEHYTFDPDHLEGRVTAYRGRYARVVIANELRTSVTEGEPICRLAWEGRRVDVVLDDAIRSLEIEIPLPRGAEVDDVDVYLIEPNGKKGEKANKTEITTGGDTLRVLIPELGKKRVVDVQYRFDGEGISVDEAFLFQPEWPVLSAEYRFSVSRDLWQEAANQGLEWEFQSQAQPRTWEGTRDDTPEFYAWYWRLTNVEPVDESSGREPTLITVTGYLPAPALASFDPDELPDVASLDAVHDLERRLITDFQETQAERQPGPGGLGQRQGTVSSGDRSILSQPGK